MQRPLKVRKTSEYGDQHIHVFLPTHTVYFDASECKKAVHF